MLILSIHEVRAGSKLAMGVMNPRVPGQELLRPGFVLDDAIIGRLQTMGVPQVFVDFPGLEDLDAVLLTTLSPERQQVYLQVRDAIVESERSVQPVVKFNDYVEATRELVKSLVGSPGRGILLDVLAKSDDAIEHATNVAHLAVVIGIKMDAYIMRERTRLPGHLAKDVTDLGVAAMLHDIGKSKLPKELQSFHSLNLPKTEAELDEWHKHARHGYEMVRSSTDATTAATILQHHQNFDGTGASMSAAGQEAKRLSRDGIHVFARILRVADLFDRLSLREDRTRRTNYEVLHLLRTQHANWLDPEVLAILPQVVPPFSPGRRVTLSDNTKAIVIGFDPKTPYEPSVKRIDLESLKVSDEVIELKKAGLRITELDGVPLTTLEPLPQAA